MTHFWPLTFGLIGFWFVFGVAELVRTPKTPRSVRNGLNRQPLPN